VLSFGQQLFQGYLYKSMADSHWEMLAKRCRSVSMMVTANDMECAADALMPTGKERRSSPAVSPSCHHPQTTHLPASTELPARRWMLCHHHASYTNVTPSPEMEVQP